MGVFIIIPTLMFGILLAAVQGFVNYAHTSLVIRTNAQSQVMAAVRQASAPNGIYNPATPATLTAENPNMVTCNSSTPPNTPGCTSTYTAPYQKLITAAYSYQQTTLVKAAYSYQQTTLVKAGYTTSNYVMTSAGYYTTQAETGYTTQAYSYYVNTSHLAWLNGGWSCNRFWSTYPSGGGYWNFYCWWNTSIGSWGWVTSGYWATGYRTVPYTYYVSVYHPPVYQWVSTYVPPVYSTTTINVPAVYSTQTINVPAVYQTVPGFWTITGPGPWTTTGGFTIINAGTPLAAAVYTGTGNPANNASAISPTFSVTPGATYTMQVNINGANITATGTPDNSVSLIAGGSTLMSLTESQGSDSTMVQTAVIPSGVTTAQIKCTTGNDTISSTNVFSCSNFSVYESAPPNPKTVAINLMNSASEAQSQISTMKYVTGATCTSTNPSTGALQCVVNYTIPLELGGSVSGSTTVSANSSAI